MFEPGDLMLFTLSSWRTMRWDMFKKMFDYFQLQQSSADGVVDEQAIRYERGRTALLFDSLGHCDVDFTRAGGRIVVAPPILSSIPVGGLPRAVLCGARGPDTLTLMRSAGAGAGRSTRIHVTMQQEIHPYAPSRIEVEADSEQQLQVFADRLKIRYAPIPPPWSMTYLSGSLEEYVSSLQWSAERELNWLRQDFDPGRFQFAFPKAPRDPVRLSRYQDPLRSIWTYRLWRGAESATVDVSWGRYAVLNALHRMALAYEPRTFSLAVPQTAPLPRLLARALVLCSGTPPRTGVSPDKSSSHPQGLRVDQYDGVPGDVLDVIALKIGQNSVQQSFLGEANE